ncbi:hypothetical protein RclHR1_03250002 [Rhizophagus clarus]|uniref:F-box domain-containing protein n=1 Tax=Rhizophagus clarus TaxID=94130 RepID=A0A2Z6S3A0_9GLOM|nr:hypothetical protein RclHR1_03250002 [Rhizophagus clarus]GES76879.1 hypothetical protein GLOIN_2v1782257 [Rhizophagus clarus]
MTADIITILDPAYSECHEIIMNPLKDDLITLYSCILVNRSFCRVFIPILWRNPFKFVKDNKGLTSIINTLIHCLNPSIKNDLVDKELILLEELPTSQTYFKYHTLIKEFELNPLQKGIRLWVTYHLSQKLTRRSISRRVLKINKYIGNLLFDKENQYESLNIYHNELLSGLKSLFDICKFDNYEKSLAEVNKLSLGFFHKNDTKLILPITKNILNLQNKLSPNIQHLQISVYTVKEHDEFSRNLIHFINSQKKLKSLIIDTIWLKNDFIPSFLISLQKQSNSLTFLKLQNDKISNELLISILNSLPYLITLYLDITPSNSHGSQIPFKKLNHLKHLYYNYHPISFHGWIVLNSWHSNPYSVDPTMELLKRILSTSSLISFKIKSKFFRCVQVYPQHLSHLHIILDTDSLDNLIILLRNLNQLIYLKLDNSNGDIILRCNHYSFIEFVKTIPITLRIFETNLNITNSYLELLFNEPQINIQIIKLYNYMYSNTSLRVFIDYANSYKKCFKELGIPYNIKRSISKDYINEAKNYFNITTLTNDDINNPFYDEPIKNSYWSSRTNWKRD